MSQSSYIFTIQTINLQVVVDRLLVFVHSLSFVLYTRMLGQSLLSASGDERYSYSRSH